MKNTPSAPLPPWAEDTFRNSTNSGDAADVMRPGRPAVDSTSWQEPSADAMRRAAFDEWRRRLLKYSILGALLAGALFMIPILQYGIGSPADLFDRSTPATQIADSTPPPAPAAEPTATSEVDVAKDARPPIETSPSPPPVATAPSQPVDPAPAQRVESPPIQRVEPPPPPQRVATPEPPRITPPPRIEKPLSQRTEAPVSPALSQSLEKPLSQRTEPPLSQRTDKPQSQRVEPPLSQRVDKPASQSAPVSEPPITARSADVPNTAPREPAPQTPSTANMPQVPPDTNRVRLPTDVNRVMLPADVNKVVLPRRNPTDAAAPPAPRADAPAANTSTPAATPSVAPSPAPAPAPPRPTATPPPPAPANVTPPPAAASAPRAAGLAPAPANGTPPPAATAAAPAAAPRSPAVVSSSREVDKGAIDGTLARYRTAFNSLDAAAAAEVWPTVDKRTLARAFERLRQQQVSFQDCQIDIKAESRAQATCTGTARYVPKVGNQSAQVDNRQWKFNLVKANDQWRIESVEAK